MSKYSGVSLSVIRRLPRYYRFLKDLKSRGMERISSQEFAKLIGLTASQIRQDLNCFGGFGQQGYGYNIEALSGEIGKILGVYENRPTIIIGAGNLAMALINYISLKQEGFKIIGIFDSDPEKLGKKAGDIEIMDIADIEQFCKEHSPTTAILAVPKTAVASLWQKLVDCGIKGFWNFSNFDLKLVVSENIAVENAHLDDSLMTLGFCINEL